jgi:hypothetical protein
MELEWVVGRYFEMAEKPSEHINYSMSYVAKQKKGEEYD